MDSYGGFFGILDALGVEVKIYPGPYDLDGPLLSEDRTHDEYDADAVVRYRTVLRRTTGELARLAGRFNGKQSPAHLFWHGFDLAWRGTPAGVRRKGRAPTRSPSRPNPMR